MPHETGCTQLAPEICLQICHSVFAVVGFMFIWYAASGTIFDVNIWKIKSTENFPIDVPLKTGSTESPNKKLPLSPANMTKNSK